MYQDKYFVLLNIRPFSRGAWNNIYNKIFKKAPKSKINLEEIHEEIKDYTIGKDDLYITVAGTIGDVGIVPDFFDGMNLTENANKLTDISINKEFLRLILMSDFVQTQLTKRTTKVAQPKLAIKRILSTKIPLPPLNEQKMIVNKLKELLPLIEQYNILDKNLNSLNILLFGEGTSNSISLTKIFLDIISGKCLT